MYSIQALLGISDFFTKLVDVMGYECQISPVQSLVLWRNGWHMMKVGVDINADPVCSIKVRLPNSVTFTQIEVSVVFVDKLSCT